jgi:hypothetical protein
MNIERVVVLEYADKGGAKPEYREGMSECCYWCGRREDEVALQPFRMKLGRDIFVNLTCKECFREYSELGRLRKKDKRLIKNGGVR